MFNTYFLYPGIALTILSSICTLFKNTSEAKKELSEQDRFMKEIKTLIRNSIEDKIDINQTEFNALEVNYRPMEKLNPILFSNIIMMILIVSGLWCRSFLSGEDKDKISALAILLAINVLSTYMNYLHRVFMLQPMGSDTTKKFNIIKENMLKDYKNKLAIAKIQKQGKIEALEGRTQTELKSLVNMEIKARTELALTIRLQTECTNLKLQLARRDDPAVATTFAPSSTTKISNDVVTSTAESRI